MKMNIRKILVKNIIIFFLLSEAIFLFNFSCSPANNKSTHQITYWSSNNTYEIKFADKVVADWNEKHPDWAVHFQPVPEGRSSEEVILAAVVGKTTPDVYSNMWQGDVEAYAQAGVLVPLDTLPGFLPFLYQRCDSAVVAEVTSLDGHIYQVPWKINPIMMIYNQKELDQIGFSAPPRTYSEFLEAGHRFQKDLNRDGYVDRWIGYTEVLVTWWQRLFDFYSLYLAASGGGSLVQGNQVVFDNQVSIDVFAFLRELFEKNYFSRERLSARQDAFLSGVIATRFTGPWEIMHAEKFKPAGFSYRFAPLPVPDEFQGNEYTYGDPKNIVIFNTCENPQRAWRFLQFFLSKKNDLQFLKITNQLPRRRNLFSDSLFAEYFQNNPQMIPFAKQAKYVKGTDTSPVLKEVFDAISQQFEACVVYGKKTPEQAIHDAARAAQLLVE